MNTYKVLSDNLDGVFVAPSDVRLLGDIAVNLIVEDTVLVGDPKFLAPYFPKIPVLSSEDVLRSLHNTVHKRYLVFNDQLVDFSVADLKVHRNGSLLYYSGLELLLCRNFALPLHIWTGSDFICIASIDSLPDFLDGFDCYIEACNNLADGMWLAKPIQGKRTIAMRADAARKKLRLYTSIIAFNALRAGVIEQHENVLEQMASAYDMVGQ